MERKKERGEKKIKKKEKREGTGKGKELKRN